MIGSSSITTVTYSVASARSQNTYHLHLVVPQNRGFNEEQALEDPSRKGFSETNLNCLAQILQKYENWHDPLATRLTNWGEKLIVCLFDSDLPPEMAFQQGLKKIAKLYRKILISPLDSSPLDKILMNGNEYWSNWMFVHWQQLTEHLEFSLRSPFTDQPMEKIPNSLIRDGMAAIPSEEGQQIAERRDLTAIKSHSFGEEIAFWARSIALPETNNPAFLNRELQTIVGDRNQELDKYLSYYKLAQIAKGKKCAEEQVSWPLRRANAACEEWQLERQAFEEQARLRDELNDTNSLFERLNAANAAHREEMRNAFAVVNEERERSIQLLQEDIARLLSRREELENSINDLQASCVQYEAKIQRLYALDAYRLQEINALRSQIGKKRGGCILS